MRLLTDPVMFTLFLLGLTLYFLLAERLLSQWMRPAAKKIPGAEKSPTAPVATETSLAETAATETIAATTARGLRGLRRRGVINALIALAPMLGLLGTVGGMIKTFRGLDGGAASQSVADGIHAALYSTEYGLALAIPAFLLARLLHDEE